MATRKQSGRGKKDTFVLNGEQFHASYESESIRLKHENRVLRKRILQLSDALRDANVSRKPIAVAPSIAKFGRDHVRVIIPDSHGSAIDTVAAGTFLSDLKRLDPQEIVMLGDHVDCGGFLAQHHTLGYVAQTEYSYADDIAAAKQFVAQIQKAAPRAAIHYIEGNHERRVETWCVTETLRHTKDCQMLRELFAPEYMLQLKERGIRYYRQSEHYHGILVPGAIRLGKCYFWHGVSAAKQAASVNINQFAWNVVYGHTHRAQYDSRRPVAQGEIGAWNPGCLCKQQPLWQHTRPTDWTLGYGVQVVGSTGEFLHFNVPIIGGKSFLMPLLNRN
jgi:UDP-2,3-diacylglucosamine pyrophosphatase LpxH